ncbi:caspase, EACC1-associated type [Actinokineospora diospyrosa]|uniref:Caspase domain-containing protein n=1 Tax=Actinokineospora diospyrosa TaxID=103728 RepID=A0ABT1IFQ2_9PSEU|nr:P-loop NTPase fold protein [Actinokineospora diospyrosa]MCP2271111.1 Caspase domain-containing protein [Actinokineospora diospyrosa]
MSEDTAEVGSREAVLIGVSTYTDLALPDIPQVRNNLEDMAQVLREQGGFRVTVVLDPDSVLSAMAPMVQAADRARDMLLVYFVGHGLVDRRHELLLGLSDVTPEHPEFAALPAETVSNVILDSPALARVLILDCSFSGRAALGTSGVSHAFEPHGMYLLTSTGTSQRALAAEGELYTAFTGELIRVLRNGIVGSGDELTLDDVYESVRRSLVTRGFPTPVARRDFTAGQAPVVRNLAGDKPPPTDGEPPAVVGDSGPPDPPARLRLADEDLDWTDDSPAVTDLLNRGPLATVIGLRLVEMHVMRPATSFLLHLDGPWGSGKSTLLNLMDARLSGYFRVARFDAWRESRLAPAWWSLLTALRAEIRRSRPRWRRPLLRLRESLARVRRTGAPYLVALALVIALSAGIATLIWPPGGAITGWEKPLKVIAALAAALATLAGGALLAARLLLWDSVRGARLFEQTQENPMADIAAHFRWLLERSDKPVVFFVDDLDRCDHTYVVDLLDTVQTLVRATGDSRERTPRAAYFVVAADGAWLRRSYETRHNSFTASADEFSAPLGYLFLDKLFQLTVPMPALSGAAQSAFLDDMLCIAQPPHQVDADAPVSSSVVKARESYRAGGLEARLRAFEEERAVSVVAALSSATERKRAEHTLRKFASVLGDNPRSVKKFVNTFSLLRAIRFLEDSDVEPDDLALWSLVVVRWPDIAHHLASYPDAVAGLLQPLFRDDHFPERLRASAASADLRAIMHASEGGPLTSTIIRKCCGGPPDF